MFDFLGLCLKFLGLVLVRIVVVSLKILGLLLVWNVDSCLGYFCLFECLICWVCVLMIARFCVSKLDLILCF